MLNNVFNTGVWARLWEEVWKKSEKNLKCLNRCAFQRIKKYENVVLWRAKKAWNQTEICTLTPLCIMILKRMYFIGNWDRLVQYKINSKVPEKLQLYGLYVYYVVHICDFGMLRVNIKHSQFASEIVAFICHE